MEADLLAQILAELHEIRKDLHWFKEREELKQRALMPAVEPEMPLTTKDRTKALAAFVAKTKKEK